MDGAAGHLPDAERLALLERELGLVKRRVAYLEQTRTQTWMGFPLGWGLTKLESLVLRCLLENRAFPGAEIADIVYAEFPPEERPDAKVIHVVMHNLRTKMRRRGVQIETKHSGSGRGYYLAGQSLEIVRASLVEPDA